MASSDTVEERNNGTVEDVTEREPCMTETRMTQQPKQHAPPVGRQTSLAARARQHWQQIRKLVCSLLRSIYIINRTWN